LLPLITLLLVAAPLVAAPGAAAAPPEAVPLNAGWEFKPDPGDQGRTQGWWNDQGNDGWSPVDVPHVFDPTPQESEFLGTVGWYRIHFTGPATPAGFGWIMHFGQARRIADVWLNGKGIGTHRDPYAPFGLYANGIVAGAENSLVVRVDSRRTAALREGWWNWGGLTRPVELEPTGGAQLTKLGLMPQLDCHAACRGRVLVDGIVRNNTGATTAPFVVVSLTSPAGVLTRQTIPAPSLKPGASANIRASIPVTGAPELWSPQRPQLYDAVVETRIGESIEQVDHRKVGLRSVLVRHGFLYLNGRRLNLRGASIHEDLPNQGPALTQADIDRIVADLRTVGANVTRAHYLLDDRLLDRFDREGILVWSQAANYHNDRALESPKGRTKALNTVRETVLAARSHPSVITHSVANELSSRPDRNRTTRKFLVAAAALVRKIDPTLPVSVDLLSYPGYPRQKTYARFDMLGINSYYGWYQGKRDHYVGNFGSLRPYLTSMHRKYPKQAMMMTEFGAEATFDGPPSVKETFQFQSDYLRRVLTVVGNTPWLSGAIYWTAREFAVKPQWDGGAKRSGVVRDTIHNKGLIAYDGTPKPAAAVAHELFTSTPMYK
jgi:beta-glucuronidase